MGAVNETKCYICDQENQKNELKDVKDIRTVKSSYNSYAIVDNDQTPFLSVYRSFTTHLIPDKS